MEKIWYGQFKPLLEEAERLANSVQIGENANEKDVTWEEYYPDDYSTHRNRLKNF
jgi:hypothetical protein